VKDSIEKVFDYIERRFFYASTTEEINDLIGRLATELAGSDDSLVAAAAWQAEQAGLAVPALQTLGALEELELADDADLQAYINTYTDQPIATKRNGVAPNNWHILYRLTCRASLENLPGAREFLRQGIDRLMRHVEIFRQDSVPLRAGSGRKPDAGEQWSERVGTAIVLARVGRLAGDIRFLNAAMRLNDILIMAARRRADSPQTKALLLLALCEQEHTARELL